jgi:hypothetical protein
MQTTTPCQLTPFGSSLPLTGKDDGTPGKVIEASKVIKDGRRRLSATSPRNIEGSGQVRNFCPRAAWLLRQTLSA